MSWPGATTHCGPGLQPPQVALAYNPGVDALQMLLPDGAGAPHLLLVDDPSGLLSKPVVPVVRTSGDPVFPAGGPAQVAATDTSAWIAPQANAAGPVGSDTYRSTFDLSGYSLADPVNPVSNWAADNTGLSVRLNAAANPGNQGGLLLAGFGSYTTVPGMGFTATSFAASAFHATCGFLPGINRLDFVVQNNELVTGLRVDYMGGSHAGA